MFVYRTSSTQLVKSKSQSSISREHIVSRPPFNTRSLHFDASSTLGGDADVSGQVGFVRGGVQRSLTLPLRPAGTGDMHGGGTIADRLAELQNNGNEWRKRVPKRNSANDELHILSKNKYNVSNTIPMCN